MQWEIKQPWLVDHVQVKMNSKGLKVTYLCFVCNTKLSNFKYSVQKKKQKNKETATNYDNGQPDKGNSKQTSP